LIFATVGSSQTPFDRLVRAVDKLAEQLTEEVVIQKGSSSYQPKAARAFDFCDPEKMASLIQQAGIVISHAGFGIIADCIRFEKRLILVPREHRFGDAEGIQIELAEYLAKTTPGVLCVRDVAKLPEAIEQIKKRIPRYQFANKIPELIQKFLAQRCCNGG